MKMWFQKATPWILALLTAVGSATAWAVTDRMAVGAKISALETSQTEQDKRFEESVNAIRQDIRDLRNALIPRK